jgi:hypothetical protein
MGSMVLDLAWWTRGDTGPSEQELAFRRLTAQLRATCFAVMLRQQAAEPRA